MELTEERLVEWEALAKENPGARFQFDAAGLLVLVAEVRRLRTENDDLQAAASELRQNLVAAWRD